MWLGVRVTDRDKIGNIDILRSVPGVITRFVLFSPLMECVGKVNLKNIDWTIIEGPSWQGCHPIDPRHVEHLRRQISHQRVPMYFKQWGGQSSDHGGSIIYGVEIKQLPQNYR